MGNLQKMSKSLWDKISIEKHVKNVNDVIQHWIIVSVWGICRKCQGCCKIRSALRNMSKVLIMSPNLGDYVSVWCRMSRAPQGVSSLVSVLPVSPLICHAWHMTRWPLPPHAGPDKDRQHVQESWPYVCGRKMCHYRSLYNEYRNLVG